MSKLVVFCALILKVTGMQNKKLIAELIGTYALVFCGTGAIIINELSQGVVTHVGIAMTFGLIILAMIYAFGEISGAHFNPAVTIAFAAAGRHEKRQVLPFITAQCFGGILGSLTLRFLFPDDLNLGATTPSGSVVQSFILEVILTFLLMLVILRVSHGSREAGIMAGLAVGSTVMLEALFAGPISGASMNPARSLAPALISGQLSHLWIYLLAPVSGALLATVAWRATGNSARHEK